jgi:CMP-N-acetylneuraminic acid synthetase
VPARAGSVGVKNKNLRMINGRSLIQRAVDLGLSLNFRVVVTTNIKKPLPNDYERHVQIYRRAEDLCSNKSDMTPVIKDVINNLKLKGVIVLLQPTSPLRTVSQLSDVLEMYFTLNPTLCLSATLNDSVILKNLIKKENKFLPISRNEYLFQNRQTLPEVFRPNGAFFIFDATDFNINGFNLKNIAVFEMDEITSLDIDNEKDFERAEKYASS